MIREQELLRLLEQYRVHYVTTGKNVARGHINVKCPWCGDEDPSEHMGIQLSTMHWGCWRDSEHRGKALHRLIAKLLRIPNAKAKELVYGTKNVAEATDLDAIASGEMFATKDSEEPSKCIVCKFPEEARVLSPHSRSGERFHDYLRTNYKVETPQDFAVEFGLRYAVSGRYRNRIIIPSEVNGKLVGWTARSIYRDAELRYMESSPEFDQVSSRFKDHLFNYDYARSAIKGRSMVMVVTEGPMDALKLSYYGYGEGVVGVCGNGVALTDSQMVQLFGLINEDRAAKRRIKSVVFIYDAGYYMQAQRMSEMARAVVGISPGVTWMDMRSIANSDDFGEMTRREIRAVCREIRARLGLKLSVKEY